MCTPYQYSVYRTLCVFNTGTAKTIPEAAEECRQKNIYPASGQTIEEFICSLWLEGRYLEEIYPKKYITFLAVNVEGKEKIKHLEQCEQCADTPAG